MRHTSAAILRLFMAACASSDPAPIGAAAASRVRPHAPAGRLDAANALARAGGADAITTTQAKALFGAPDVERRDGVGALMIWTTPACALTLGFVLDRLHTVTPGPRRTGERAPSVQECLAELRARDS